MPPPPYVVTLTNSHPCWPSESNSRNSSAYLLAGCALYVYSHFCGYHWPSDAIHQPGPGEGVLMSGDRRPPAPSTELSLALAEADPNRALLFRDPDGNLVNLFTPVTDEARAKFGV